MAKAKNETKEVIKKNTKTSKKVRELQRKVKLKNLKK